MAKNSIFQYDNYKVYINDYIREKNRLPNNRGLRSRLAEAADCHTAFISQVLNGDAHFSLEQTERISRFIGLVPDEKQYLIFLVQFNRAGSVELRSFFQEQLKLLRAKQLVLKDRLQYAATLTRENQLIFYSSWHYGAIHVLVSVPGCNTEEGIASYLRISRGRVAEILKFLLSVGLVVKSAGRYSIGKTHIHLEHDSPMISKHHTNWRMMAIRSMDTPRESDLHYSSVITCTDEDSERIKTALVEAIDSVRAIVRPSENENAFVYCLDFFPLKASNE